MLWRLWLACLCVIQALHLIAKAQGSGIVHTILLCVMAFIVLHVMASHALL